MAHFTPKTPYLTTDGIIELYEGERFRGIVLIARKNPPVGLALPGGFVDVGERVEQALVREMREETGLDVQIVRLLGIFSDPKRDPRFHTASAVFVARAEGEPKAGDDAKEAYVYALDAIPFEMLVFDHANILRTYLKEYWVEKNSF
ncbi:ADP-ribose pyrophosphatase [hydrothermal vent metagenome]|uniref:ADP-ribose pyrophosphatase n=1 Tax=hydrothermal vent metagenome TaxID=652676 RepID=A0A1W1E8B8_9ZZZZ